MTTKKTAATNGNGHVAAGYPAWLPQEFTITQAAALLRLPEWTIRRMINRGELEYHPDPNHSGKGRAAFLIPAKALEGYYTQRQSQRAELQNRLEQLKRELSEVQSQLEQ